MPFTLYVKGKKIAEYRSYEHKMAFRDYVRSQRIVHKDHCCQLFTTIPVEGKPHMLECIYSTESCDKMEEKLRNEEGGTQC